MNCPSRTDDTAEQRSWNHNLLLLNSYISMRKYFNVLGNFRVHHKHATNSGSAAGDDSLSINPRKHSQEEQDTGIEKPLDGEVVSATASGCEPVSRTRKSPRRFFKSILTSSYLHCTCSLAKFARFVGPGFLIAVAYIDPGNYSTDVSAGADFKYALLFIVLMSNIFAILLQTLCIKLGTVTGLNLAENCRKHLPRWLVIILYIFAESAIIATDIAEVWIPYS